MVNITSAFIDQNNNTTDNNELKRSLAQDLLSQQSQPEPKLDKVDQSFENFRKSLENKDIITLMEMYAAKATYLCGYDINSYVIHSQAIDTELLKQLQEMTKQNIELTKEQYQALMILEKRDIN